MYRPLSSDVKSSKCYCCCKPSKSDLNELDMALNELGMLSCVTPSRSEYLQEMKHRNNQCTSYSLMENTNLSSGSRGYKIIQIDTKFVTGVSSDNPSYLPRRKHSSPNLNGKNLNVSGAGCSEAISSNWRFNYRNQAGSFEEEARQSRLSRIKLARQRRFRKPYNVPGRLYHSMQESDIPKDEVSPRHISKSNSNSPNKLLSGPLVRSKSLDNLDLTRLKLTEFCQESVDDRQDIDQVSLDLTNLQVS
ncbi:hypothetical protein SNE40_006333 [Patella caerulea]|uniref:Uncharacterized protein n=1 Tax=Patella caerulea TaxID=87958 RepID=A0AAN8K338_PATCE